MKMPSHRGLSTAVGAIRTAWQWILGCYRKHPASYLIFCFLLPFSLMLFIYAVIGTFPFGRSSVLVLDLNGQYVYFFEALRDCVWGDSSLLYSFGRSLGGEFLGMYAYYLASPLSYLVALFPENGLLDALFLMLLIKQGLSGLSFGWFLRKTARLSPVTTVMFSVVYSMTAYGVVMQHNTMWTDNVILLPLIALGMRALVTEGKWKLYTFSLLLALMSNYYIGYMTCLFAVLYFFSLYLSLTPSERNPRGQRLHLFRAGARFGFFSLLAGAVSMLIVIPAVYSLTFGKTTFSSPTYEFSVKLDLLDVISKLFFGSYDTVRPEGLPFIYCGIITLMLLPFYFASRRVSTREKGAGTILCLLLVFSFSIQMLDMAWHGGQAPNWLNYRYSYMLCFVMVGMAAKGFEELRAHRARTVLFAAAPLLFFLVLAEHFEYKHINSIFIPVGLNLIAIGAYVIAIALFIHRRDVSRRYASLCMLVLVSVELILGGLLNIIQLDMDVVISSRDSYYSFKERWQDATDAAKAHANTPFFRMETTKHRNVNVPYMLDYRGVSGSTSTLNRDTIAFLNAMGYSAFSHASCYTGINPFVDSFLSISYVSAEAGTVFPEDYIEIYNNGDVVTYYNPNALPIAFGVADTVNGITFYHYELDKDGNRVDPEDDRAIHNETSPFLRMNALASALLGEEVELFKPVSYRYRGDNVAHVSTSAYYGRLSEDRDATVSFTLSSIEGCELFAYFPTDTYTTADYYLNGTYVGKHFLREESGYLALGSYREGEECTLSFTYGEGGIYIKRGVEYFFAMDRAVYERLMTTLGEGGYRVQECTEDSFLGTITVREGYTTVLTTIPYDKGWQITVDGERIEGYETLDALLAFDLTPGEHTLSLRYMPKEYEIALGISAGGTALLTGLLVADFILERKKRCLSQKQTEGTV